MVGQKPQELPDEYDFTLDFDDRTPLEIEDDRWDAFLPDEGPYEPLPEPGDFWFEEEESELLRWVA